MDKQGYAVNEKMLPHEDMHDPYHTLFSNMRPSEIILLMLFSWSTVCPYEEELETNTKRNRSGFNKRKKAWNILFGQNARMCDAIKVIIEHFVASKEDILKAEEAINLGVFNGVISANKFESLLDSKKQDL